MAEGGGTVSWLTRPDGNSSHYVVEYDGRVVQMVPESLAAGSLNPNALRTGDDAAYSYLGESVRYGRTAAVKILGTTGYSNPNAFVIAIEVEGYAATGPNSGERNGLNKLVADIRRRVGPLGVLGHRDFQSYKACPGHRIPWVDYGGHTSKIEAPAPTPPATTPEEVMKSFAVPEHQTLLTLKEDPLRLGHSHWMYSTSACLKDGHEISLDPKPFRELPLVGFFSAEVYIVAYEPPAGDTNLTSQTMFVKSVDVASTRVVPVPDVRQAVNAAVDHISSSLTAVTTAISEARVR